MPRRLLIDGVWRLLDDFPGTEIKYVNILGDDGIELVVEHSHRGSYMISTNYISASVSGSFAGDEIGFTTISGSSNVAP